jgi:hypothetical protein
VSGYAITRFGLEMLQWLSSQGANNCTLKKKSKISNLVSAIKNSYISKMGKPSIYLKGGGGGEG